MAQRIAALGLALGLLAAPASGVAALETCPPCCAHAEEVPCEGGGAVCVSLSADTCCGESPVSPTTTAKRRAETPPHLAPAVGLAPALVGARPASCRTAALWCAEPSRLSVVLRL